MADQRDTIEHIVQDAGTGPELEEWVRANSAAQLFVEKDKGMYDAVNKGLQRSKGEICAYLNCDEQYLPGTVEKVRRAFDENPNVDLIAGDFLVVNEEQQLLAFRKATPLRASMIRTDHLYDHSCALFFRRRIIESGFLFDPELKDVADAQWVSAVLEAGFKAMVLPEYLATFTYTGENRSLLPLAQKEARDKRRALNPILRIAGPLLREIRHVEKLFRGGYRSGPIAYEVFVGEDDTSRTRLVCERPSSRYPGVRRG